MNSSYFFPIESRPRSLKESNLKLHAVMEEMLAKIESKNGELASLKDNLESAATDLEKREMESGTQIGQLKKLVDHLQGSNSVMKSPKPRIYHTEI